MNEFVCPKCRNMMRTYNRNGISIEQCDSCRGIFLDYGELEALARVETQYMAPPPAAPPAYGHPQPGWGAHGAYGHRQHGLMRMLFSS
jgi:Zn-finger nucleic acid-binding protein